MKNIRHYVTFSEVFTNTKINQFFYQKGIVFIVRCKNTEKIMRVLNVAEKNDAAKNIAGYLSRGNYRKKEGLSIYNKIYEFNVHLWNEKCQMIMTSVSGHLLNYEFIGSYKNWQSCHPLSLFDAPIVKNCKEENDIKIKKTIEREVKNCKALIIWTDCDREGENIGFEIAEVCQAVKPEIRVYRAKFSEITQESINRALRSLENLNKAISDAVNVRSELDLRIGAAFTRFQTLRLQQVFPSTLADMIISYGSCQFPTLGFVVERFLSIEKFCSEPYWKLKATDIRDDLSVEFRWGRVRLFEELPCQVFLDICLDNPTATVIKVTSKPKSKWRPLPLDTIELEKQGSRKLHLDAKTTMKIAEKLYTQGLISYPRTETNIFPKELNLQSLVDQHVDSPVWGTFAQRLMQDGIFPRQGKKSDQAHPPIHPTKYTNDLQGNEAKVYEFVVRHFLACLSKNAEGQETLVEIDIAGEKFATNGLQIIAKNYLEIYIYEKWSDKEVHRYEEGQKFEPTKIEMLKEETSPPKLLTEADLIALMDKHGIGTDATHAEHIDKIKSRQYVGLVDTKYFMPSKLGIGLVMGYDNMGYPMSKPNLRMELEKDLQLICDNQKDPNVVLQEQIRKYRDVFKIAMEKANLIDKSISEYLEEKPTEVKKAKIMNSSEETVIFKCPKCGSNMILKDRKQGTGKYIGCMGFPACNNAIWFPQSIEDVTILDETCTECSTNIRKIKFKLHRSMLPFFGSTYTTCIGGCDPNFNQTMDIRDESIKQIIRVTDSGYESINNRSSQAFTNTQMQITLGGTQSNSVAANQRSNYTARNETNSRSFGTTNRKNNNTTTTKKNNTTLNSNATSNQSNINNTVTWGNIDNNAEIMCQCHEVAIQLTVRKEGPNQGRQFYKCAKPQGTGCDFFMWSSDNPDQNTNHNNHHSQASNNSRTTQNRTQQPSTSSTLNDWGNTSASETNNVVMCVCNEPAKQFIVQKEGPNKGRPFYSCPKGRESTCKFFKWADEDQSFNTNNDRKDWGSFQNRNSNIRGKRDGSGPRKPRTTTSAKRKCGICGTEGHTRKTCPENAMDK